VELIFEGITRTTGSVTDRASALDHESCDDPVKRETVIEILLLLFSSEGVFPFDLTGSETDEVLDCLRRMIRKERDGDVTFGGM